MHVLKFGLITTLLITLNACATSQENSNTTRLQLASPHLENPQSFNNKDRDTCYNAGGHYEMRGMLGYYRCTLTYADGGKICSDDRNCLGHCRATNESEFDPYGHTTGQTGACQMNDNPFGCHADIIDGSVQPTLCVD